MLVTIDTVAAHCLGFWFMWWEDQQSSKVRLDAGIFLLRFFWSCECWLKSRSGTTDGVQFNFLLMQKLIVNLLLFWLIFSFNKYLFHIFILVKAIYTTPHNIWLYTQHFLLNCTVISPNNVNLRHAQHFLVNCIIWNPNNLISDNDCKHWRSFGGRTAASSSWWKCWYSIGVN